MRLCESTPIRVYTYVWFIFGPMEHPEHPRIYLQLLNFKLVYKILLEKIIQFYFFLGNNLLHVAEMTYRTIGVKLVGVHVTVFGLS